MLNESLLQMEALYNNLKRNLRLSLKLWSETEVLIDQSNIFYFMCLCRTIKDSVISHLLGWGFILNELKRTGYTIPGLYLSHHMQECLFILAWHFCSRVLVKHTSNELINYMTCSDKVMQSTRKPLIRQGYESCEVIIVVNKMGTN